MDYFLNNISGILIYRSVYQFPTLSYTMFKSKSILFYMW